MNICVLPHIILITSRLIDGFSARNWRSLPSSCISCCSWSLERPPGAPVGMLLAPGAPQLHGPPPDHVQPLMSGPRIPPLPMGGIGPPMAPPPMPPPPDIPPMAPPHMRFIPMPPAPMQPAPMAPALMQPAPIPPPHIEGPPQPMPVFMPCGFMPLMPVRCCSVFMTPEGRPGEGGRGVRLSQDSV